MFTVSRSIVLGWVALIGLAIQAIVMLPKMPSAIATSFGTAGVPHAWMTHSQFVWFEVFLVGALWTAFFVFPKYLDRFPNSLNIPNRGYWMAPERRAFTLRWIQQKMQVFGVFMLVFIGLMMQATFQANLSSPVRLDMSAFMTGLGVWMAFVLLWTFSFLSKFRRLA